MNHEQYEELIKKESTQKSFFDRNIKTANFLLLLTFGAQLIGAFFSYFEVNKIMFTGNEFEVGSFSYIMYIGLTIIILAFIEGLKRVSLSQASNVFKISRGQFKTEFYTWLIIGVLPIMGSFYFAVNGAISLFEKKDQVEAVNEKNINKFSDSLTIRFNKLIDQAELERTTIFNKNQEIDSRIIDPNFTDKEKKYMRKQYDDNNFILKTKEDKIKELKKELKDEVKLYETTTISKSSKKSEDFSKNALIFGIISFLLEGFILFGIFRKPFVEVQGLKDYETKLNKDPKFKMFNMFKEFADIIYKEDYKVGDAIPVKSELQKLLRLNKTDLYGKELDDALRLFSSLGILQTRGRFKYLKIDYETAKLNIKKYLKVD